MEGITNSIWGPVYWKMFHYVTLTYPIIPTLIHIEKIKYFFCELVPVILPCRFCRKHYQKNLELNPLTDDILAIKFKLVIWLLNMHNYVNKQLGKNVMSYEDALVTLFIPEHLKEKNIDNNPHYDKKKELYHEDKLKSILQNLVYIPSENNFIYNVDSIIKQKETELENKKLFEKKITDETEKAKKELDNIDPEKKKYLEEKNKQYFENIMKLMTPKNISSDNDTEIKIEITKQENIDMNIIINKLLYYINKCDNDQDKYLIYTSFESICFIFN
jgi:hypothetical protein